ncbi:DUF4424 domain-containing protein [Phyllobacterium sp. YR531]|uniref:DUF4424 domain-containing protein n=1 Tax=Phyllobacterium sp. YR531 TaxID=1144343 RepID=UPI00026F8FC7|nr:DUF4424 domain-containing protein [Phyllobacterium sp. YR531]EJN04053.1 hypothetical protein PMI41_01690 [Phyllobacterium sp. YR531]
MLARFCLAALSALLLSSPVLANDTTAAVETGGLVYTRNSVISMEQEDLFISENEIRVDYVFRNTSNADVENIIAFPMPELQPVYMSDIAIPDMGSDNFLDFTVTIDGKPIKPELQQRGYVAGLDITDVLVANNIPISPQNPSVRQAVENLDSSLKQEWENRGILQDNDEYALAPAWVLKSTYWWVGHFPAGKDVRVSHRYKPSVGGTVSLNFDPDDNRTHGPNFEHAQKYCRDKNFNQSVAKIAKKAGPERTALYENWISYILTTGGNWAGPIKKFKLTIDKGDTDNLISFCGDNVKKIGPTTFEMTAQDFWPERDLEILLLKRNKFE